MHSPERIEIKPMFFYVSLVCFRGEYFHLFVRFSSILWGFRESVVRESGVRLELKSGLFWLKRVIFICFYGMMSDNLAYFGITYFGEIDMRAFSFMSHYFGLFSRVSRASIILLFSLKRVTSWHTN